MFRQSLAVSLLGLLMAGQAQAMISSHFDTTSEGWTVVVYDNDGFATGAVQSTDPFSGAFGTPPGSIVAVEEGPMVAARFNAPGAYLGDLSAYIGGSISFDLRIVLNPGTSALPVTPSVVEFVSGGVALGYTGRLPTTAWGDTFVAPLNPTSVGPVGPPTTLPIGSWIVYDSSTGPVTGFVEADMSHFVAVLSNVTSLTINGEVTDSTDDSLALDNVVLAAAIPVPAALPLFGTALLGLLLSRRRL